MNVPSLDDSKALSGPKQHIRGGYPTPSVPSLNKLLYIPHAGPMVSLCGKCSKKKAIDYKPLIVFREKLSSIKTTVIMDTKCWGFY